METELEFRTLIDLFNESLFRTELAARQYLEIVRAERQENITFGQLKTRAQDFALWLVQTQDIRMKDKIAILGKNRADWDVALWGVILAGAVPVLIDPERPVQAVREHLLHTDARLIVMADDYRDTDSQQELKEFASHWGLGLIEMTVYEKIDFNSAETNKLLNKICTEMKADDTAVILCTSGITDDPREVELTHANLIANVQGTLKVLKVTMEDKLVHIIPPHHSF